MKLKAFDIDDILIESKVYKRKTMLNEIKEKLNPYVLHFIEEDSIGLCLKEQKNDIIKILKEYGELNTKGNFINADTFLCNGDYGWDNILLGNYELNAEEVWEEFGKLLKRDEQMLLDSGDKFKEEWHKLQKFAIMNIWIEMVKDIRKEIEFAEKDLEERVGMYR